MAEGRRRRENNSEDEESNLESGSPSLRRSRRRSSTSRNQRNRSEGEESESASYSGSDSPSRSRRRKSSSRRRRNRSEDDGEESDTDSGSDSRRRRRSRRRSRGKSVDSSESESEEERSRMKRKITEEEIIEYMAKKSQKKALKVAKNLKSQAVSGYSNDSNPFGDSNLGEKFVWRKKIERDVVKGRQLDISVKAEKKKQKERMAEIEKVKKRREERAIEKAQHEEEMALLARERARAEFQDWEKREEEFNFYQSKIRSQIRLHEGRMKPIDILSKNLNDSDEFDIEINEPYTMFTGLTVKEMEELHDDIKMHIDSDRATATHIEFWEVIAHSPLLFSIL